MPKKKSFSKKQAGKQIVDGAGDAQPAVAKQGKPSDSNVVPAPIVFLSPQAQVKTNQSTDNMSHARAHRLATVRTFNKGRHLEQPRMPAGC